MAFHGARLAAAVGLVASQPGAAAWLCAVEAFWCWDKELSSVTLWPPPHFPFFLQPSCEGSELWPSAATWDLVLCSVLSLEVFLMRKDDELVKCSRGFYPDGYQQGRSCNNLLRTSLPVPEACGKKRRWQSTRETLCILPPYTYLFSQITTSKIQHIAEARVGPASRNLERERGGTVFVCTCVLPESR